MLRLLLVCRNTLMLLTNLSAEHDPIMRESKGGYNGSDPPPHTHTHTRARARTHTGKSHMYVGSLAISVQIPWKKYKAVNGVSLTGR